MISLVLTKANYDLLGDEPPGGIRYFKTADALVRGWAAGTGC